MTYYGYDDKGRKFRFNVQGHIGFATGAFSHCVSVFAKQPDERNYEYQSEGCVHCCYNSREAAEYYANQLGVTLA